MHHPEVDAATLREMRSCQITYSLYFTGPKPMQTGTTKLPNCYGLPVSDALVLRKMPGRSLSCRSKTAPQSWGTAAAPLTTPNSMLLVLTMPWTLFMKVSSVGRKARKKRRIKEGRKEVSSPLMTGRLMMLRMTGTCSSLLICAGAVH